MAYKPVDLTKLIALDIETLSNCFVVNALDINTKKRKAFVIYEHEKYADQPLALFNFLKSCVKNNYCLVTFNGLGFDLQILHIFYDWCCHRRDPLHELGNTYIAHQMYLNAQRLIDAQNSDQFADTVQEHKLFMSTIDLFKQLQLDRKKVSLKWIEFSTRYHTIQEMPIEHYEQVLPDQVEELVEYCWNDVYATAEFFEKVKYETEVRLAIGKEFDLNLINAHEARMVRDIFGKYICEELGISYRELKEKRTPRSVIKFEDIIFPYIQFQTPILKELLKVFKETIVSAEPENKKGFELKYPFKGSDIIFGLGGIHYCVKPGVYTHTEDEVIEDADGTSYYPFIAMENNLYPEHLRGNPAAGEENAFIKTYKKMYKKRAEYPKKDPRNYIYKIILNSCFGLSSEPNGYMYDPKFTYAVTVNGQLNLLMLVEALNMSIPGIQFIQMNTDGITYKYNKQYTDKVRKICTWWEKVTKINLEYAYYKQMIIRDVNNYIGEYEDGKLKNKGMFETDPPFYKNPSMNVVPKALEAYFIKNIKPESFVKSPELTIFDFCCGTKKTKAFKLNLIQNYNFAELITEQQKVCRYIISKQNESSGVLVKDFTDGRRISVMAKQYVQPLDIISADRHKPELYSIDYDFYLKEIRKWIAVVQPPNVQQTLF